MNTSRAGVISPPLLNDTPRAAVVSDAIPERNGVGSYYRDFAPQLEAQGVRIEVFHPDERNGWSLPLPGDSTQRLWLPALRDLKDRIERFAPHVLILPTPGAYGLYGLWLARRLKLKVIIGFHTDFEALTAHYCRAPWDRLVRQSWRGVNRRLFRHSAAVVTTCARLAEQVQILGAAQTHHLGAVLGPEFLTPPSVDAKPLRSVLFAGRLAAEKNLAAFLRAVERLPDLDFHIAGDGPGRHEVITACARLPNLHYHGWCQRHSLRELMDASDLLVLPSHVESFGTVALEAMARARLVLVSAHCGLVEWPGLASKVAVLGKNENLATAIERLRRIDPRLRHEMARSARSAALNMNAAALSGWKTLIQNTARAGVAEKVDTTATVACTRATS
ncbi:glycosyltransferase [Acidihalobacter ferrooxydans]|uniref:Glycosyl transferase family 1 n=1 Tax=Acidihalobacter ferrooxydans TaxID=1765967 RepID=A0A1P8UGA9_9GAMM|nr:glycosyltransferase [Acidihalobacter ferrooxydans]APZ42859.1 hypothetical protein BW247_06920 [Acidihalobacter ferrooxydans]